MAAPTTAADGPRGAELYRLDREPETVRDRVQRLQQEARLLAREEVQSLETRLAECIAIARSIGEGGDAYPAGVRELCERMTAEIEGRLQTLTAIADRTFDL
ncbi:MAG: hypothetical protein INR64_14505 [Caulobacteraceae bacterium]|nr:hypothetical protein [Caulobacter sp.]